MKEYSPNTGAYCQARSKLSLAAIQSLAKAVSAELEAEVPSHWLWEGRHVKIVDGTTLLMADTKENQTVYPQQSEQKSGCGYPILRAVAVMSLATGSILDLEVASYKGKQTGEVSIFKNMLDRFSFGDIVLADAIYPTYFIVCQLMNRGIDIVAQSHGARTVDFRKGRSLGVMDHIVTWSRPDKPGWMSKEEYDQYPHSIEVRECRIKVKNPVSRAKEKTIVTTLLDPKKIPKKSLTEILKQRWYGELYLRNVKTTMDMEMLSCKTPDMIHKEIWANILAYNLICRVMCQAAILSGQMPRQISFKGTIQTLEEFRNIWLYGNKTNTGEIYRKFLEAIAKMKVANRPGRIEPRLIKRRTKKQYGLLSVTRKEARKALMRAPLQLN